VKEDIEKMKNDIIEVMNDRGGGKHVSFAELTSIDNFNGSFAWGNPNYNIWFWADMSKKACDAMDYLIDNKIVKLEPANRTIYLFDGCMLTIPIAKRKNHKYKKPRWLPVTLNILN